MTWTEIGLIVVLTPFTLLAFVAWATWEAWWKRKRTPVRTEAHDDLVVMMTDWITDPHILKAAYKAGALTAQGQARLLWELGEMDGKQLAVCAGKFLGPREVREAVAKHMQKQTNYSHRECRQRLAVLAERVREMERGAFRA